VPKTIGYHWCKSAYGLWLPGDDRGHWSEAWDAQIGFIEPHALHPGDPVRKRMAAERMKHPAVRFDAAMRTAVENAISECTGDSPWRIAAASIEATHTHLVITYSGLDIHRTLKWLSQCTTKAVHQQTSHLGPVWCEGSWCTYLFDDEYWPNTIRYVERHNERRGVGPRPYSFITSV
jgi:REP element-mobilizing transposase RayT